MMEFDWKVVVELAVLVIAALVSAYLIPWLKAKIGEAEFRALWERICILVQAAEQLFPKSFDGEKTGEQKKEWTCEQLTEVYGIEVTEVENALIEAAVHELTDL